MILFRFFFVGSLYKYTTQSEQSVEFNLIITKMFNTSGRNTLYTIYCRQNRMEIREEKQKKWRKISVEETERKREKENEDEDETNKSSFLIIKKRKKRFFDCVLIFGIFQIFSSIFSWSFRLSFSACFHFILFTSLFNIHWVCFVCPVLHLQIFILFTGLYLSENRTAYTILFSLLSLFFCSWTLNVLFFVFWICSFIYLSLDFVFIFFSVYTISQSRYLSCSSSLYYVFPFFFNILFFLVFAFASSMKTTITKGTGHLNYS